MLIYCSIPIKLYRCTIHAAQRPNQGEHIVQIQVGGYRNVATGIA